MTVLAETMKSGSVEQLKLAPPVWMATFQDMIHQMARATQYTFLTLFLDHAGLSTFAIGIVDTLIQICRGVSGRFFWLNQMKSTAKFYQMGYRDVLVTSLLVTIIGSAWILVFGNMYRGSPNLIWALLPGVLVTGFGRGSESLRTAMVCQILCDNKLPPEAASPVTNDTARGRYEVSY
jgi:hypothetical protein